MKYREPSMPTDQKAMTEYIERLAEDFPEELSKENVNRENVMSLVQFKKLYISNIDGRIAWLCECPTAEEDGLAFEFTDGEIETISQTDII